MPEGNRTIMTGKKDKLSPALTVLAHLEELETKRGTVENSDLDQKLLEESLGLSDQALRIFQTENEIWLTAWISLHKASLLTELARHAEPSVRPVHAHSALELAQKAVQKIEEDPSPDLKPLGRLYAVSLDVVLRIRSLLVEPGQIEAIDMLIRQLGSHLGEIQALDLTMRSEAYDLLFSAQVLNSLVTVEKDPDQQQEMRRTSQKIARDAFDRLRISSPGDLSPLAALMKQLCEPPPESLRSPCPRCGAENNPGAAFCSQCGATMARSVIHQEVQPSHVCRRCSHINREDARFCTYCGAGLNQES